MDKFKKEVLSYLDKEDLNFTEEDRRETFNKIRKNKHNTTLPNIGKRYGAPVFGSVIAVLIAIMALLPNLNIGSGFDQQDKADTQQAFQSKSSSFSVLLMGVDSTDEPHHRSNVNMLLTYNSDDNSMNIVPIPRDTYVDIFNSEGEMIDKGKVMHAFAYGSEPKAAVATISNLFDMSIDYYAVISEENIYEKLEVTEKEARVDRTLSNGISGLIEEKLSETEIKSLLKESETNIPSGSLNQMEDMNTDSIQVIDVAKGVKEKFDNEVYYVKINQKILDKTSNTLKKHLGDN